MIGLPEYIILLSQNWIVFDTVNSLPPKKLLQKEYRLRCVEVSAISGISHTSLKNSEGKFKVTNLIPGLHWCKSFRLLLPKKTTQYVATDIEFEILSSPYEPCVIGNCQPSLILHQTTDYSFLLNQTWLMELMVIFVEMF